MRRKIDGKYSEKMREIQEKDEENLINVESEKFREVTEDKTRDATGVEK